MIASEPFQLRPELKLRVTASVGLATLESVEDTPETILKRADNALYAAKRRGRNRVAADAA
jgi:two-component system cell cycle response regulator